MHFLSSWYFLGFNLNRKHIYTLYIADWVALPTWRLRGGYVAHAWLLTWHRRVLKHPDGSEPSDGRSTAEIDP